MLFNRSTLSWFWKLILIILVLTRSQLSKVSVSDPVVLSTTLVPCEWPDCWHLCLIRLTLVKRGLWVLLCVGFCCCWFFTQSFMWDSVCQEFKTVTVFVCFAAACTCRFSGFLPSLCTFNSSQDFCFAFAVYICVCVMSPSAWLCTRSRFVLFHRWALCSLRQGGGRCKEIAFYGLHSNSWACSFLSLSLSWPCGVQKHSRVMETLCTVHRCSASWKGFSFDGGLKSQTHLSLQEELPNWGNNVLLSFWWFTEYCRWCKVRWEGNLRHCCFMWLPAGGGTNFHRRSGSERSTARLSSCLMMQIIKMISLHNLFHASPSRNNWGVFLCFQLAACFIFSSRLSSLVDIRSNC